MVLIVRVVHVSQQLSRVLFLGLSQSRLGFLLRFTTVTVVVWVIKTIEKLDFLLGIAHELRLDFSTFHLSLNKLGLDGVVFGHHFVLSK